MKLAGVASLLALVAATSAAPAVTTVTVYADPVTVTVYENGGQVQDIRPPSFPSLPFFSRHPIFRPQPESPADSPAATAAATSAPKPSDPPATSAPKPSNPPAAPAPSAPASVPTSVAADAGNAGGSGDWVRQMLCRVNKVRDARGAPPLGISTALINTSQGQSNYQNSIGQMTHSNPAGGLGDRLTALGVDWRSAAENVAAGMSSPDAAQEAWENSAGHLANMVDSSMAYFGAARTNNYWTQNFYGAGSPPSAKEIPVCN
ncbi:hypothetical protein LPJ61_001607 [Coemansia biformis]|uniref:SCP domain-containing protein n=1 Tax=Coemansia biformis TaxID=1286918 RepID=A0A9W7Y9Q7_9FUNG|nr:hypothetical protein LPJ61_001607 [Coemansia biformis]